MTAQRQAAHSVGNIDEWVIWMIERLGDAKKAHRDVKLGTGCSHHAKRRQTRQVDSSRSMGTRRPGVGCRCVQVATRRGAVAFPQSRPHRADRDNKRLPWSERRVAARLRHDPAHGSSKKDRRTSAELMRYVIAHKLVPLPPP